MIHYHGGDINPETCAYRTWRRRHAFISHARPAQLGLASSIVQSFALDNGAFSKWKAGKSVAWAEYYEWVDEWQHHPRFDFAVVPDVIEGSEEENDALAEQWPFDRYRAAVVWHTNESPERLERLAKEWPRVAIGSSGEYDVNQPARVIERMYSVLPRIVDSRGFPICMLHGLRMLNPKVFTKLPLKSADSTNVARNIKIDLKWNGGYAPATRETRADVLTERIENDVSADRLLVTDVTPHAYDFF